MMCGARGAVRLRGGSAVRTAAAEESRSEGDFPRVQDSPRCLKTTLDVSIDSRADAVNFWLNRTGHVDF